ncbi:MAG: hydrogenase maturation nickel metallochaperone HypA [Helicobacteraceae bacterium]
MHEYSVVKSLIDLCEENARANGKARVLKVEVKVGVLSGIEPQLLQLAFDTFKEGTMCAGAEFFMHVQKVQILCHACQREQMLEKNEFLCPACGAADLDVLDGEEAYLMRLELDD